MPAPLRVDWNAIYARAISGVTLDRLSVEFGVKRSTLSARSAREGWKKDAALRGVKNSDFGARRWIQTKRSELLKMLADLDTMEERLKADDFLHARRVHNLIKQYLRKKPTEL